MTDSGLEVVESGALTTVQDHGRPGLAHLGVPRSGALDAAAARLANRLVGNQLGDAVLETTATGCVLRATAPLLVAVTGAPCPVFVGSVPAPFASPMRLAAGQVLEIAAPARGVRSYVAVRGGVDVPPVLGSRSRDILSGLGPTPLRSGDWLAVGASAPVTDHLFAQLRRQVPPRNGATADAGQEIVLPLRLGPRHDWFAPGALATLMQASYTVSSDSNRVGLRLTGPVLERAIDGEIASEGMVLGAVQVPPSGEPVVFLADHPVTGGYPVIGVIDAGALAAAAQARAGETVRFSLVTED